MRALLYDFLQVRGGAEALSLWLAEQMPETQLWAHRRDRNCFPDPLSARFLSSKPLSGSASRRGLEAALAFSRPLPSPLAQSRAVLFSGHYAPLAATRLTGVRRVFYGHCPPLGFALDAEDPARARLPGWQRPLFDLACGWLIKRYRGALQSMDLLLANSAFTAARIEAFCERPVAVLHPPCPRPPAAGRPERPGEYYLSIARHEPGKGLERLIDAFARLPDRRLVIASAGSLTPALRARALGLSQIEFHPVTEPAAIDALVAGCIASLYLPAAEPFGLSALESLAAGRPVIGCAGGGLAEILEADRTGPVLAASADADTIAAAVRALSAERALALADDCLRRASAFSKKSFLAGIETALAD